MLHLFWLFYRKFQVCSRSKQGYGCRRQGLRSKILSGGLKREPDLFFFFGGGGGGGGRGAEACYPGKIRVLVTLRYRKVDLK